MLGKCQQRGFDLERAKQLKRTKQEIARMQLQKRIDESSGKEWNDSLVTFEKHC